MVGAGSLALVPVDWQERSGKENLKPLPKEFMNILQEKNQLGTNHMLCITCKCLSPVDPSAEADYIRGTNYHIIFAAPTSKAAFVGGVKEFPGWSNFGAIYQQKLHNIRWALESKTALPYNSVSDVLAECIADLEQRGLIPGDAFPNELVSKRGNVQGIAMGGWSDLLFGIGRMVQAVTPHAIDATKAAFQACNSLGAVAHSPPAAFQHVLLQNPSASHTLAPVQFVSQTHPATVQYALLQNPYVPAADPQYQQLSSTNSRAAVVPAAADLVPPSPQDPTAVDRAASTCATPMEADLPPPPLPRLPLRRAQGENDDTEEVYEGLLEVNETHREFDDNSRLVQARLFVNERGIATFEGIARTCVSWSVMDEDTEFKNPVYGCPVTNHWTQPVAANKITKVQIQWAP